MKRNIPESLETNVVKHDFYISLTLIRVICYPNIRNIKQRILGTDPECFIITYKPL